MFAVQVVDTDMYLNCFLSVQHTDCISGLYLTVSALNK